MELNYTLNQFSITIIIRNKSDIIVNFNLYNGIYYKHMLYILFNYYILRTK